MAIDIRPFEEADRPVVRQLTIAAFEGVSIDHNIDSRLGHVAGRDWRWRKSRDIDRDIDEPCTVVAVAANDRSGAIMGYVTMQCDAETRIGWIHNLAVAANARGQGVGTTVDRARCFAFPRGRHDDRQDRDPRTEFDRAASLSIGRFCRNRPADSLRNASFEPTAQ